MSPVANTKVKQAPKQTQTHQEPKRLSKAGEWMRANPNGIGQILDMRAVMR